MAIRFRCRTCNASLKAPEEYVGRAVKCKACEGMNPVPQAADTPQSRPRPKRIPPRIEHDPPAQVDPKTWEELSPISEQSSGQIGVEAVEDPNGYIWTSRFAAGLQCGWHFLFLMITIEETNNPMLLYFYVGMTLMFLVGFAGIIMSQLWAAILLTCLSGLAFAANLSGFTSVANPWVVQEPNRMITIWMPIMLIIFHGRAAWCILMRTLRR